MPAVHIGLSKVAPCISRLVWLGLQQRSEPRFGLRTKRLSMSQPDEAHYKVIINAIKQGGIVPFLGSGINLADRPDNFRWEPDQYQYIPSGTELAAYLTDKFIYEVVKCPRCSHENQPPDSRLICEKCAYPIAILTQDLPRVSQYVDLMTGSGPLYQELHSLFDQNYRVTSAHRYFANLPSLLREKGYYPPVGEVASLLDQGHSHSDVELMMLRKHYSPPLLIVTTNYDDLMERAFKDAEEPFDLFWYAAHGKYRGKVLHRPANEDKVYPVDRPKNYVRSLLVQHPVILKIHGAVRRGSDSTDEDSYVITEDHYIDYLTRTEIANLLPSRLVARLQRCHFLFLGYGLRDWNLRVILHRISGKQQLSYKSWAIQRDIQEIERQFWSRRNVDLYNERLKTYISELDQRLQGTDPKPAAFV
jgi:hypothetical protein